MLLPTCKFCSVHRSMAQSSTQYVCTSWCYAANTRRLSASVFTYSRKLSRKALKQHLDAFGFIRAWQTHRRRQPLAGRAMAPWPDNSFILTIEATKNWGWAPPLRFEIWLGALLWSGLEPSPGKVSAHALNAQTNCRVQTHCGLRLIFNLPSLLWTLDL